MNPMLRIEHKTGRRTPTAAAHSDGVAVDRNVHRPGPDHSLEEWDTHELHPEAEVQGNNQLCSLVPGSGDSAGSTVHRQLSPDRVQNRQRMAVSGRREELDQGDHRTLDGDIDDQGVNPHGAG